MEVALIIFALLVFGAFGALIAWSRTKTQVTTAREALVRAEAERDAHAKSLEREVKERTHVESLRDDLQVKLSESVAQSRAAVAERDVHTKSLNQAVEERRRIESQRDDLQTKLRKNEAQLKAAIAERDTERQNHEHRLRELDKRFKGLAADIFKSNSEEFRKQAQDAFQQQRDLAVTDLEKRQEAVNDLVKPVGDTLEKLQQRVGEIEKAREGAYTKVHESITHIREGIGQLSTETGSLREALRSSKVRGYWGEQELRNIIEFAGMTEHVSFVTQETTSTPNEASDIRPDLIVNIPGGVRVVVDSKTPFDAYIEACNTTDRDTQRQLLNRHVRALMGHARELERRDYSRWVKGSPDFVVMFIGADGILNAALDTRPALWEEAWQQHKVLIATPLNLIAFLRTVALAWREQRLQADARNISNTAAELYDRLRIYLDHVNRVGANLNKAVDAHNKSIRSLNSTVLPHTRKLEDRGITKGKDIPQIDELPVHSERFVAPELSETQKAGRESTRRVSGREPFEMDVGSWVVHPEWGRGKIQSRKGSGQTAKLTVRFDGGVIKTLVAKYANLQPG